MPEHACQVVAGAGSGRWQVVVTVMSESLRPDAIARTRASTAAVSPGAVTLYRAPSRAALMTVMLEYSPSPKSTMPATSRRNSGITSVNSTSD